MAASVKLVHRTSKTDKKGEAPIYLRITKDGKSTFLATGVKVIPKLWNEEKEKVRSTHAIADTLNGRITDLATKAQQELLLGRTRKQVKQSLTGTGGDFVLFTEAYIEDLQLSDRYWEAKKFQTTLNKCRDCWGTAISWKQVSPDSLTQLYDHMGRQFGNSVNTRRKEISRIRRLVRIAIRKGNLSAADDPFIVYQIPKGQRVERRKLTLEEITQLEEVELGSFSAIARDAFLFSFYCAGVRFGDLCVLTNGNVKDGRLVYRAAKTKKPLSIPMPPQAKAILDRYQERGAKNDTILPLLPGLNRLKGLALKAKISSRNAQVNTYLKRVAEKAGVDPKGLSMHVARHSYADYARRVSGDIHAIMQALGHSDVRVTQTYLKELDNDAVDSLSAALWS